MMNLMYCTLCYQVHPESALAVNVKVCNIVSPLHNLLHVGMS